MGADESIPEPIPPPAAVATSTAAGTQNTQQNINEINKSMPIIPPLVADTKPIEYSDCGFPVNLSEEVLSIVNETQSIRRYFHNSPELKYEELAFFFHKPWFFVVRICVK